MKTSNPLKRLSGLGQSVWLDFINREMLGPAGELKRLIEEDALSGVTSNPAIFERAINGSSDYDEDVRELSRQGKSTSEIAEALAIEDVRRAADLLRPTYDGTGGADGFVSIEVSPKLALDSSGSITEARRLWTAVNRPNLMVKIPGTKPGLFAIRQLLREGINVNITLLFSVDRYLEVHERYLEALEERTAAGERVGGIASVASFFLSRIDTLLDPELDRVIRSGGPNAEKARDLPGALAIANAKVAYQEFLQVLSSSRWHDLARAGARPQRLLWASTGTKNPAYGDIHYIEPLIAPETVNTMPLETLTAYRDHGNPALRIHEDLAAARERLARLNEIGLDLEAATRKLEEEGIRKFVQPLDKLLTSLERKRASVGSGATR